MIAILILVLLATPSASADVQTCPGGPQFGFVSGSDKLDARTETMLSTYVENLNAPLWRSGWITVSSTVLGPVDERARVLAGRRKITIALRLSERGLKPDRVRFESFLSASPGGADADVYPSTLSTTKSTWEALVTPGVNC